MTALLVPISLDALVVRPGTELIAARTAWASPSRPAIGTMTRQALAPPPFTDLPTPRAEGVHLDWAVTDTQATRPAGAEQFPALPSRWVVVRLDGLADAATPRRVTAWMLPNIHADPATVLPEGQRTAQRIGPANVPTSVRGRGRDGPHPTWALDYDGTLGRLALHDPLTDADLTGPLAYTVIGWYTHPQLDPLTPAEGVPATPSLLYELLERLGWTVDLPPGTAPPTSSIYHGSMLAVGWPEARWPGDGGGRLAAEVGGPPTGTAIRTAIADNLIGAVATLLDGDAPPGVAALSEAVLNGSAAQLNRADGAARIDSARHRSRFRAVAPATGTTEVIYEAATPTAPAVPLPPGLTDAVDAAPTTPVPGRLAGLAAALAAAADPIADAAADGDPEASSTGRLTEVTYPTPRTWRAGDPVVAVAGLGRTLRHGADGRFHPLGLLDCRVTGQTVTAGDPGVLPAWPVADDVPVEVTGLVRELAALDPGSVTGLATAGDLSAAAAARASWWDTWASADRTAWRTAPEGTGWSGVLPSPIGVRPPARPWSPLRLDWEVALHPSPTSPSHWRLGELDFDPAQPFVADAPPVTLTGIGWLSAAPADLAAAASRAAGEDGAQPAAADVSAAAFEGFRDRIRGVPEGVWVGPRGIEDRPPRAVLDAESYQPRAFVAGTWRLTRLRAVDTFGQVVVLYDDGAAPPAVPAELRIPGVDGIALRPRFTAAATLAARFLDPEPGSGQEAVAGRNPLCGFLMPSPYDGTVELIDPAGMSVARLRRDPRSMRTVLEDTPGAEPAALCGAMRIVADALVAADSATTPPDPGRDALSTLLRIVNAAGLAVDSTGRAGDAHLALLLGNPLSLIRIQLTLTVDDPQGAAANAAVATPVRLGSIGHLDDGVLAWFLEDAPSQIHPIHDGAAAAAAAIAPEPLAAGVGDPLVWLTPGVPRTVLALLVPAADITVISGLLPQKQLQAQREWTDTPLRKLTPTLGFDAVLRDPAAVAIPVPGGIHGTWTWYTRRGAGQLWTGEPVSSDPATAQPGTPVAVEDGYLRVVLTPDPPYRGDPLRVDCVDRGLAGAIEHVGGINADGSRWRLPVHGAVRQIEAGRLGLYVQRVEQQVDVTVAADGVGVKYLTAIPPGEGADLLAGLSACPVPVRAPDVLDLTVGAATAVVVGAGLAVGRTLLEFDVMPRGQVIGQSPPAGELVGPALTLDLTVSRGPAVLVPLVVGLGGAAAGSAITGAGLVVGTVGQRFDAAVARGLVLTQRPQADTEAEAGSAVDLTLSLGPAVTVPVVVGQPRASAVAAITGAGLTVGAESRRFAVGVPLNQVVEQQPPGGTQAARGDAVALTLSDGTPVTVPQLIGKSDAVAVAELQALGLDPRLTRVNDARTRNSVISQQPVAGTQVRQASRVDLSIATGQVTVPPVVGMHVDVAAQQLGNAGLVVGNRSIIGSARPKDEVLSQMPIGGAVVFGDSRVDLVVSAGGGNGNPTPGPIITPGPGPGVVTAPRARL